MIYNDLLARIIIKMSEKYHNSVFNYIRISKRHAIKP